MGAGRLKRAIWIQANAKGRFGFGQSKGVPWMQAIAKGRFGFERTRETHWVHTSLKGCFGYGLAVSDERHLAVCSVLPHCSSANKYVRS